MNYRFKFRAWDKINEEWLNIPHLSLDVGSGLLNGFFDYEEAAKRRYVLEQCTGLRDKNGKLIYEGDIVREISKKEPEWEEYITEVKWEKCGFNLYSDEDYDFEIIGNIHENPELLEEYNAD